LDGATAGVDIATAGLDGATEGMCNELAAGGGEVSRGSVSFPLLQYDIKPTATGIPIRAIEATLTAALLFLIIRAMEAALTAVFLFLM
jgi:hypothetical protein